jgi:hypothetical protein
VKFIAKSFLLAFMGTGLFFFFLMMALVPTLALLARTSGNIAQKSVVVDPAILLRTWGLPMAAVMFVVLFALAFHKMRKAERLVVQQ